MKRRKFLAGLAAIPGLRFIMKAQEPAHGLMTPVLTRSYTNARDCANTNEKILTVANVKARGMRQYFSVPMEGDARGCEAQPLIVPSVPCSDGVTHDLVIACSMNNDILAFDANDSTIIWEKKVGYPVRGSTAIDMFSINNFWGILSTGVIDPDTNRLYVVAWISHDGTPQKGVHYVKTLDLRNGDILESVSLENLTYDPGNGLPIQKWSAAMRKQRSSLLMTNIAGVKTIFFASGSILETSKGASGWVVAYSPTKNTVTATFALTSRYYGGGVWMAGQGLASDSKGYIYGVSGNGSFDAITDFSECAFKLQYVPPAGSSTIGKLVMADWISPYDDSGRVGQDQTWPVINYKSGKALEPKLSGVSKPSQEAEGLPVNAMSGMEMEAHAHPVHSNQAIVRPNDFGAYSDQDLGSSGVCLIEGYDMAMFGGKDGIFYSARMSNMGKTKPEDFANPINNYKKLLTPPIWGTYYPGPGVNAAPDKFSDLDFMFANRTHHQHSTPAVAMIGNETRLFCWGENSNLRGWRVNPDGSYTYLGCSAEVASPNAPVPTGGMPGAGLSLTINGTDPTTAILWAAVPLGDANKTISKGYLMAFDAWNLGRFADGSGSLIKLWQSPEIVFNKFMVPVISGGRLFYASYDDQILCLGLA